MALRQRPSIAILGCGAIAAHHSRTLAKCAPEVPRFYASRDPRRAEAYRRKFRGDWAFGSYEEAIGDERVDAVLVVTPPDQHLPLALAALGSGKDVIVEKPPFLSSAEFQAAREACERFGRRLFVAENYFYRPFARRLRELLAAEVVGEVLLVQVNALKTQSTGDWRDDPAQAGGGALFEGGIHWVNFLANLGMTVESVAGHRPRPIGALDRTMVVVFEYAEGAVATLQYSWEAPVWFRGLSWSRIVGRRGVITFETNGAVILVNGTRKRLVFPGFSDIAGYRRMFRDFVGAMRTGEEAELTVDMAERDLRLVEEACLSAESSGPREVEG